MAVGDEQTSRVENDVRNIFKFRDAVKESAAHFHKSVLENLMIEKLKRQMATYEEGGCVNELKFCH